MSAQLAEPSLPTASVMTAADPALLGGRTELAFVLDNVTDWPALVQGVRSGVGVVVLDSQGDALAQMAAYLRTYTQGSVDAVHLLGHGGQAAVQLGTVTLTPEKVAEHAATLADIGAALTLEGDLLLYGCDVAQGAAGEHLVDLIAQATGADVAASADLTGSSLMGGDWVLEYTGQAGADRAAVFDGVQAASALGAQALDYAQTLAIADQTILTGSTAPNGRYFADASGNVYAAYRDTSSSIGVSKWNGTAWSALPTFSASAAGLASIYSDVNVAVDGQGYVHVVFRGLQPPGGTSGNRELSHATYNGSSWSFESIDVRGSNPNSHDDPYIKIDAAGKLHVLYKYSDSVTNYIVYKTNVSGSWVNSTVATLGSGAYEGYSIGLNVAANGDVYAYYKSEDGVVAATIDNANLYYAVKPSGGSWSAGTKIVDNTGNNASYKTTNVELDANGMLHVAYSAGGVVYYATNASGTWQSNTVSTHTGDSAARLFVQGGDVYVLVDSTTSTVSQHFMLLKSGTSTWITGKDFVLPTGGTTGYSVNGLFITSDGRFMTLLDAAGNKINVQTGVTLDYFNPLNTAPTLATPATASYTDTAATDAFSNATGTLSATDADGIASYGIQAGATGGSTNIGGTVYDISKAGTYGTLYVVSSGVEKGKYAYVPNAVAMNAVAGGNPTETFTVTATDANASPATGSATFTVNLTGANDTPTNITLAQANINQSAGANATIGGLTATDADTGQSHTYSLVTGSGSNDNALFNIAGTSLRANDAGALAAGTYSVRVQVSDGSANYAKPFTITVVDDAAPRVASIERQTPSSAVTNTDLLVYRVTFSEAVNNLGAADFSVSGTTAGISGVVRVGSTNSYDITVSGGDLASLNGNVTLGFAPGQDITDTAGNPLGNSVPTGNNNASYALDNTPPFAPSTPVFGAGGDTGSSSSDGVTKNASPQFTGMAENGSTVTLYDSDGTTVLGSTLATGGNWTIAPTVPLSQGSHTLTVRATDAAGNTGTASSGLAVQIDTSAPTGLALSSTAYGTSQTGSNASVATLTASDNLSAAGHISYALAVGNTVNDAQNGSFNIVGNELRTNTTLPAGTYHIYLQATDEAGNVSYLAQTVTIAAGPAVSDARLSVGGGSGTGGAYKAGDIVTATWNGGSTGDNASGVSGVTFDFSQFGGGAAVAGSNSGNGVWTASYTLVAGTIDATNRNVSISATNPSGTTTVTDSTNTTVDNQAPTVSGGSISFSGGSGTAGAFKAGDTVTVSWNNTVGGDNNTDTLDSVTVDFSAFGGGSAVAATNTAGTWTASYQLPAGASIDASGLQASVSVKDNTGNTSTQISTASVSADAIVPVLNPAISTPMDNASGTVNTGPLVLRFGERLAPASLDTTKVYLRDIATHTLVTATVAVDANGNLTVTPTAALGYETAYAVTWDAGAFSDLAGNPVAAVANDTTYNFTTAAPSSDGGGTPSGQTVDGTTVQAETTTNSDGSTTTTTTVAPVPANRPEDPSTPNNQLADIPLAKAGSDTVLQIGLPVGVGVTSSETSGNNLGLREKLMGASQPLSSPADFAQLLQTGIDTFVPGVQDPSQVTVRTLTLTSTASSVPGQPITISGANGTGEGDAAHPQRQEALVIDARQLPPGSVLKFDKVEFAIVIGAVRIIGGEGANFVVGDSAAQFIVLGAGDDVLRGGAGDDVVGSRSGNDRLYGDEGNDKLVGGVGNDHLEGGAGNDILVGGASDGGNLRFTLGSDGNLQGSYTANEAALSELTQAEFVGNWQGGIAMDPRLAMVYNQDYGRLETTALLFQGLTGKLPTLDFQNGLSTPEWTKGNLLQGAWNWYESTLPANLGTADKAKALITQTVGTSMASAQNVQIAVGYLGQGGTWTQALDFLIHQPQVKNAITVQTAGGASQLNLIQSNNFAEAGWSFDSGNDTLLGGAGNDVLIGGGGNDVLDGGEGTDMAVYFGTLAHYAFTLQTNSTSGQQEVLVRHIPSGDVDTLRSVELLQVGGQAYRIDTGALLLGQEYALAGHVALMGTAELVGLPAF